jgi:hypothetical protein
MELASVMEMVLTLVLLDSTPDSSTASSLIPFPSMGHSSAGSQPHNGIRYIPTRWVFMDFASVMGMVLTGG